MGAILGEAYSAADVASTANIMGSSGIAMRVKPTLPMTAVTQLR